MAYLRSIRLTLPQNSSSDRFFLPTYKLAKYLVPILSTVCNNTDTVLNSHQFVSDISRMTAASDCFIASFDVDNLFTNVPLAETIDIILDVFFFSKQHLYVIFTKYV